MNETKPKKKKKMKMKIIKQKRPEMFLPNELMIYSSTVYEKPIKKPNFLINLNKKRQLVLTNFPRLLCIKEEKNHSITNVKLKIEILFKSLPKDEHQEQNQINQNEEDFLLFKSVELENCKTFSIHTSLSKVFRFEDPSECAERWTDELNLAFKNAQQQQQS
ncbi:hypothetical protein CROQUDRAFT_183433 [Cronartium quercuum f. sp. fusiforme G11]|uniref:PH domain-containing protein n=1 Tax=Cronartium quercuum f. sp. fusiforme G11 TaxID=708437 RepID=A0A9P6N7P8_9BASI|nr:hypothetical protein CROQUDRAFT_183433 [Cronartium quercuum f. sp. fusiforme G11]